jgi:hypothetical protein
MVMRDRFPLGAPTELGVIEAPDEQTARQRARATYGPAVLVRAMLALESERRETLGPGRIPARQPRPSGARERARAFNTAKREAAREAKRAAGNPMTQLELPRTDR